MEVQPDMAGRMERFVARLERQYRWAQMDNTVTVSFPVAADVGKSEVAVEMTSDRISAGLRGAAPIVSGELFARIVVDDSVWSIEQEDGVRMLILRLEKSDPSLQWPTLMRDGPLDKMDAQSVCHLAAYREAKMEYDGALEYYTEAAERDNVEALLRLAYIHAVGREESQFPVERDEAKAFEYHLRAAELDSSEAQYFVAHSYHFGTGVPVDFSQAARWYERALQMMALTGAMGSLFVVALFNLGLLYYQGTNGLERNVQRAVHWWAIADKKGSAEAAYNLAVCFATGDGLPESVEDALKCFRRAAAADPRMRVPTIDEISVLRQRHGLPPLSAEGASSSSSSSSSTPARATPKKSVTFAPDTRDPEPKRLSTPPLTTPSPKARSKRAAKSPLSGSAVAADEQTASSWWSWGDVALVGAAVATVAVAFMYTRKT